MRTLKTIVIVLGVLLVVGFGVLVFGLTQNWHRLTASAPATAPTVARWGRVALGQPADSRIQGVTPAGSLVVVQVIAGSEERLLVLDPATGAVVGTFALTGPP